MFTCFGSTKFKERQPNEGNSGSNGDGSNKTEEPAHQSGSTNAHLYNRTGDNCALHMLHPHLPSCLGQRCHSADSECGRQKRERSALNNGKAVTPSRLKQCGYSADEKHGGDEPPQLHRVGNAECWGKKKGNGQCGTKHSEIVLQSQNASLNQRRFIINAIQQVVSFYFTISHLRNPSFHGMSKVI